MVVNEWRIYAHGGCEESSDTESSDHGTIETRDYLIQQRKLESNRNEYRQHSDKVLPGWLLNTVVGAGIDSDCWHGNRPKRSLSGGAMTPLYLDRNSIGNI